MAETLSKEKLIAQMREGFETAFINGSLAADSFYKPSFISNNPTEKRKVIATIEDELSKCESYRISVAFITDSGIEPLKSVFQMLEEREVSGEILTTDYLCFSEPKALKWLNNLKHVTLKMYKTAGEKDGFHTKGYIFQKDGLYRVIIGSSNITKYALTTNREWNTRLISTESGEMVTEILREFNDLWDDGERTKEYSAISKEYEEHYNIVKHQREIAKSEEVVSLEKYTLKPNSMQDRFVAGLRRILEEGKDRALLISATGTGKTYASAFGMRENGFKRVLFVVHRNLLAANALKSYERVFPENVSMGIASGSKALYGCKDKDYIFVMVNTISKEKNLRLFQPDSFDAIIFDETHRGTAESYQKVMRYFKPRLWLGMTATPDKRDDNIEGRNVYELYNHNIAYEIRLQQALEEDLLCPFHYFGITDVSIQDKEEKDLSFLMLTSDDRVKHIVDQACYYGYSGDKVKGLIFCSKIKEAKELSKKLNRTINPDTGRYFRTIALNGDSPEKLRQESFERLATDEGGKIEPLDYILSVEILNEGVDIIEVNQVIMLRPTQSPIIFIQQLGRGLRKANGKEYVVILDFIGNYKNNFMIPIALSGDRTYNADNIRRYVISGNNIIPGTSTVHFDEIAKNKIFQSIDKIKGLRTIIKDSYTTLKNRLGRVPYLVDFYENGEVDPVVIIKEYKTYQNLLFEMEGESYSGRISKEENLTLEYLSKTILSGVRPYELIILDRLADTGIIRVEDAKKEIERRYDYEVSEQVLQQAAETLTGTFTAKQEETEKYMRIAVVSKDSIQKNAITRLSSFAELTSHSEFYKQLKDIVAVGLKRFDEKYIDSLREDIPFVLYEKYSRRDVCLLMNCGRDLSSTMYGMKRIGDDVFIFVTYKKEADSEKEKYVDGKPDYADEFVNEILFKWDSQMGKGVDSPYMEDVCGAKRKHLFVKKSDAETGFYYMGQFDMLSVSPGKKRNKNGEMQSIAKCSMRMHHPVREDILRYLQSGVLIEDESKKMN